VNSVQLVKSFGLTFERIKLRFTDYEANNLTTRHRVGLKLNFVMYNGCFHKWLK